MLDTAPLRTSPVAYEVVGNPTGPVVAVLGGISADRHVCSHSANPRPGWWEAFAGSGRPVDTRRYRILSFDYSTSAETLTTSDQAAVLAELIDHLGIEKVDLLVGASYGGMISLSFASLFPRSVSQALVISAAHESHPMATALRSIQRQIVRLGQATGEVGEAMAIARALAMTTYRSASEFRARFPNHPDIASQSVRFPVDDYLDHQGRKFANRIEPEHFLALSESLDLHRVDPETISVPLTLVGVEEDVVVPLWQMRELYMQLGAGHELIEIRSQYGHDAFLKETDSISEILRETLKSVRNHNV